MAEFADNNVKNVSISHNSFELNCDHHLRVSYKEDIDSRSKSKSAKELAVELRDLKITCQKNLPHSQGLQKKHQNKTTMPKSHSPGDKVWLNSK